MVRPAKEIGGDLYDFYVRHDKLFFCVGDVSGKGVPASLVMATVRSLFRSITSHEEQAHIIMRQMNDALSDSNEQNMFVTLSWVYWILNPANCIIAMPVITHRF